MQLEVGDAVETRFEDRRFDAVFLQHVAMNVSDRASLYAEVRRVLKSGGRFATYDVCRLGGEPRYPVPWPRSADTSFLLTAEQTVEAIGAAGLRVRVCRDEADRAKRFFAESAQAAPSTGPTLGLVMGPEFRTLAANLARSIAEDRLTVLAAVFDAV